MARPRDISSSEITPESLYLRRWEFLKNGLLFTATTAGGGATLLRLMGGARADKQKSFEPANDNTSLEVLIDKHVDYTGGEARTPFKDVTEYNNFYEFGTDKSVSNVDSDLLAGFQDNGTDLFTGTLPWNQSDTGDGGFVFFDHSKPDALTAEVPCFLWSRPRDPLLSGRLVAGREPRTRALFQRFSDKDEN